MRSHRHFAVVSFAATVLTALPGTVLAQATARAAQSADAGVANAHSATPGMAALARGNAAFAARDWAAALTAFREAQGHQEQRVEATLGVGSTLAQQSNADGALASYREAMSLTAGADAPPMARVRALQMVATQLEALARWADALAAWNEFVTYAAAHPTVANAEIGRARVQAIQARDERERSDAQVRQRIEERRRRNATPGQNPAP
jgi:tetratricopeptide (TPR) repeat protein